MKKQSRPTSSLHRLRTAVLNAVASIFGDPLSIALLIGGLALTGYGVYLLCGDNNLLQILAAVSVLVGGLCVAGFSAPLSRRNDGADELNNNQLRPKERREVILGLRQRRGKLRSNILSVLILTLAAVVFFLAYAQARATPGVPHSAEQTGVFYERGKVTAITDSYYQGQQEVEDVPVGSQTVTVEITSGEHEGESYSLKNNLSYLYGTVLKVGDPVTVSFSLTDGKVDSIFLEDYDRTVPTAAVVLVFLLITILVGGKIGAKSLLGLGLTILCVFAILIPLLLNGYPTLLTIFALCAYVTVVEFVILGGVNKKTVCAILGTIGGVFFAMLFGYIACKLMRVDGFKMYVAEGKIEALLQIKQTQDPMHSVRIGDLLVGGILIAALGAVNDVAMSISSAMNELVAVNPNLTRRELLRSGMNIGRDMVGTMTNTLILALVGGGLVMMIYFSSLEPSFTQLMTTAFLSVEMVQALASSAGVILAVPLSVLIGMALFGTRHPQKNS